MTEEKKELWSMEELVALTDEVQISEVMFREKVVEFQFCELVEKEEPKIKSQDGMSEDDKMGYFQELGAERVERMIAKANEKNPDGPQMTAELWDKLPSTLRYKIQNTMMGVDVSDFQVG